MATIPARKSAAHVAGAERRGRSARRFSRAEAGRAKDASSQELASPHRPPAIAYQGARQQDRRLRPQDPRSRCSRRFFKAAILQGRFPKWEGGLFLRAQIFLVRKASASPLLPSRNNWRRHFLTTPERIDFVSGGDSFAIARMSQPKCLLELRVFSSPQRMLQAARRDDA